MCIIKIMLWDMNHSLSFVEGVQTVETIKTDENHIILYKVLTVVFTTVSSTLLYGTRAQLHDCLQLSVHKVIMHSRSLFSVHNNTVYIIVVVMYRSGWASA